MNEILHKMVDSLVIGDSEKAKEHLSQYFNGVASGMISDPTPAEKKVEESTKYAFDVFKDGKKIDTVFSTSDSAEEMKKSLIDHDGYDSDISVKLRKEKK